MTCANETSTRSLSLSVLTSMTCADDTSIRSLPLSVLTS